MPSKRVIANIILYQGMAVQSIGFERYLPIGKPEVAARFLSEWGLMKLSFWILKHLYRDER